MFFFKHPFTCIVSGPTQSGKSHFLESLLLHKDVMIYPSPKNILWCYGQHNSYLENLPSFVKINEGLIESFDDSLLDNVDLLVMDDLMNEGGKASFVQDLFTKGSHHRDLSVILVVQNLFHQGKVMRSISLNSHYMILFKNPRNMGQITHLGSQLCPGNTAFIKKAYKEATKDPYGYLVLDFTQDTPDHFRVVSGIFPGQQGYFYQSEK